MAAYADAAGSLASERPWVRTHLQAPRDDGGLLSVPALGELGTLARANAHVLQSSSPPAPESWLAPTPEERRLARLEATRAALSYTGELLQAAGAAVPGPETEFGQVLSLENIGNRLWFVTGHQPALFHPGVWIKNRVVAALARAHSGVSLNLIVDNDTTPRPSVLAPGGSPRQPVFSAIPYDEPRPPRPWEEATVADHAVFSRFGTQASRSLQNLGIEPLVVPYWNDVVKAERILKRPGAAFSAARAHLERQLGWGNLELPLSRLCELDCFRQFAGRLLAQLPRLHGIYNQVLTEYRTVNRVRSRTHPVPDLRAEFDSLEAPFWVWEPGGVLRRRLRVRQTQAALELHDGQSVLGRIPRTDGDPAEPAIEALRRMSQQGVRLRTRALSTTLFSRLYLADLFVHGIGGAKYDEMTDRMFRRFYDIVPPAFAAVSATVRLPVAQSLAATPGVSELQRTLRDLDYHAERYLDAAARQQLAAVIAEKSRLIAEQHAARQSRLLPEAKAWYAPAAGPARYRRLQQVNRELARSTENLRAQVRRELEVEIEHQSAARVLRHREYAFCLFPRESLREFFDNVCNSVG